GISAQAISGSMGNAGDVTVTAGALSIANNGAIVSSTSGSGKGGSVTVTAGTLTIVSNGEIFSSTFGPGNAGSVAARVAGGLVIDGTGDDPNFVTGISSRANAGSTGNAGSVTLTAGRLSIVNGGSIASDTSGPGDGGGVLVTAGTL